MDNKKKTSGGGYIPPVAYAKAKLIRTPLPFHIEWNKKVNACTTLEEVELLGTPNKRYARRCSVTGEGMNEGWVWFDGMFYTKYEKDTIKELHKDWDKEWESEEWSDDEMLEMAVSDEVLYWTNWEDESEWQYAEVNGELIEIQ